MWNAPTKKQLEELPEFYSTEEVGTEDKVIHMHFFISGCDWYIIEYSEEERLFYGFTILNGDTDCAEWGYVSFDELKSISKRVPSNMVTSISIEVDRDLYWKIRTAKEVDKIIECAFTLINCSDEV